MYTNLQQHRMVFQRLPWPAKLLVITWGISMLFIISVWICAIFQLWDVSGIIWPNTFLAMLYYGVFIKISMDKWGKAISKEAYERYHTTFDFMFIGENKRLVTFLELISDVTIERLAQQYFFFKLLAYSGTAMAALNILVCIKFSPESIRFF